MEEIIFFALYLLFGRVGKSPVKKKKYLFGEEIPCKTRK